MANWVSSAGFAEVGAFGNLDAQVLFFEEIIVFLVPTGRYAGVFASYDRRAAAEEFHMHEVTENAVAHPDLPNDPDFT